MAVDPVKTTLKKLDEHVARMMNKNLLSGMGLGIVQNGKVIFAKGFGLANAAAKTPVTPDTVFRIASISKTFTAIGVMQLWEQGKFQLDDPINDHLTSFKVLHDDPSAPPVTIRHMLTHTSGIGEAKSLGELVGGMLLNLSSDRVKPGDPIPPLAEYYNSVLKPDVYPGEKWAYANHAFSTLGQLIEDVSGEPFPEYMIRHVFEPLGMNKTDYLFSSRVRDGLAQGYEAKNGRLKPADLFEFPDLGAGSVYSSVDEMSLYLAALMNGGKNEHGSVLNPETLKLMMTPQYQEDPHLAAMGLGFMLENEDGHWAAWHGGALPGFNSALWVAPEEKLGLIVWSNTATRAIYYFGEGILRSLLGLPDYEERLPKPGVINNPHIWQELVGTYKPSRGFNSNARIWFTFGGDVEISVRDNQLMMRALAGPMKNGLPLYSTDPENPLVYENVTNGKLSRFAFKQNNLGVVDRLDMTALSFYSFYKKPMIESLRFQSRVAAGIVTGFGLLLLKRLLTPKKR